MTAVADATFERQAQLLETIHRCARELQELVGDALVVKVEPAGRPSNQDIGKVRAAAVLDVFRRHPGEWLRRRDVVNDAGIPYAAATTAFNRLNRSGALEHNGQKTNGSRYRLAADPLPGGASSNGRVRADLPDRIVQSLRDEAATLTELCMRLDVPRRDVRDKVRDLLAADPPVVVECGVRFPRKDTVYGATDE